MIEFNPRDLYFKNPFGAITRYTDLSLRVKIQNLIPVEEAVLIMSKDGLSRIAIIGALENSSKELQVFHFDWTAMETGLYFYHFELLQEGEVIDQSDIYQLTVYSEKFDTPKWLRDGIMYQIFPDRFSRSMLYPTPKQNKDYVLRKDWDGLPNYLPDENGIIKNNDFFGGNLHGIIEKLDYLSELGVTIIYLNPIFESYSNHRYDTGDFKKIDPMLGTEDDFIELCSKAKEKGIRIILDGVFNHTGSDSLYFNKEGRYSELGAYQSQDSKYYSWYKFIEYPDKYESWWGIDTLPSVDETDKGYMEYILTGEDSVVKHWLRCGASGFRLDVADELPDEFLDQFRATVKEVKPDAAIIGEVWEDASNKIAYGQRRRYLHGDQLDSVMNYPLRNAIIKFLLNDQDAIVLENTMNSLWENYPDPAHYSLMNILGTHDTPRILSILTKKGEGYEAGRQRLFLALILYAFMPGTPCIYYGDKLGMTGGKDPFNRCCFNPELKRDDIFNYYKKVFAFRRKISNIQDMVFSPGAPSTGSIYNYQRVGEKERLLVAINGSNQGDYYLNLQLNKKEVIKDILISGSVSFQQPGQFLMDSCSGFVAYICTKEHV
ncbi:MAG: glycoside hydrolase family 13 protein [Anaerovoracaceae bacterium]